MWTSDGLVFAIQLQQVWKLRPTLDIVGDPQPNILIDTTLKHSMTGRRAANLVKQFARSVGLPTVSTSYGMGADVEPAWMALSKREREWLVHVQPPGDVFAHAVPDIVRQFNLTTAAIIYDNTFGDFSL